MGVNFATERKNKYLTKTVPTDRPYLKGLSARKTGFLFFVSPKLQHLYQNESWVPPVHRLKHDS